MAPTEDPSSDDVPDLPGGLDGVTVSLRRFLNWAPDEPGDPPDDPDGEPADPGPGGPASED